MKIFKALALLFCLFVSTTASALSVQLQKIYFPGSRGITVVESQPKPLDTLTLGFGFNYAINPFEFGRSASNVRIQGIVDHLFTFDFAGSYSFSDRFALGVGIPVHITNNIISDTNLTMETKMNLGDIMITGLYNFISRDDNDWGFGVAVMPFVTFPSGRNSDFVGDSNVTGGAMGVADIELAGHYLGVNLGFRFRETEDFLNLSVASEMLFGLMYHHTIIPTINLDGFLEFHGATVFKRFLHNELSTPFEGKLGLTLGLLDDQRLKVTMAHGLGFGNGYASPDYRLSLKVVFDHLLPRTRTKKVEVVKVIERIHKIEKELEELTIYYPTDGSQVDPFYDKKIAGIAKIFKRNPNLAPLYIVGHTDNVGGKTYNKKLSERRAKQAHDSILEHDISPEGIVWLGVGEEDPAVLNDTEANRARNRRVLFTFIKPKQLTKSYGRYRGTNYYDHAQKRDSDSYTEVLKEQERQRVQKERDLQAEETKTLVSETRTETEIEDGKVKKKKTKKKKSKKDKDTIDEDIDF